MAIAAQRVKILETLFGQIDNCKCPMVLVQVNGYAKPIQRKDVDPLGPASHFQVVGTATLYELCKEVTIHDVVAFT
jgi:hypothetical protein